MLLRKGLALLLVLGLGCSSQPPVEHTALAPVPTRPAVSEDEVNPDPKTLRVATPTPITVEPVAPAPGASAEPSKSDLPPETPAESASEKPASAPATPAPDEPTPAPKPAPKPAAKSAADVDYFRQLPPVIELPPLPEGDTVPQPVAIGSAALPASVICIVHLLGGEHAHRGARKTFRCEEDPQLNPVRAWHIDVVQSGAATSVARLELRDARLWFQWLPQAAEESAVSSLANCVLRLNAGTQKRQIALRKPLQVPALGVGFERTTGQWEIPNLPRLENIKVELRLVADRKLRYRFVGPSTLTVGADETWLSFGLGRNDQGARLKLELSLSRFLKVTGSPQMQLATHAKPVSLNADFLKKTEAELKRNIAGLEKQLELAKAAQFSKLPKGKSQPKPANDPTAALQSQLKQLQLAQEQLEQIRVLEPALAKARLQVRVFYEADEALVDLLVAQDGPPKK